MKKIYINPKTTIVTVNCRASLLLSGSANITGGVNVTYGGVATGTMTSDSRQDNSWDIWGTGDDFED